MNIQVFETILKGIAELDPIILTVLQKLLDAGLFVGPLAKFKPCVTELQAVLSLLNTLHATQLPPK